MFYNGTNGLYGDRHKVKKDFRPAVREQPKQKDVLFIPLEGLVDEDIRDYNNGISDLKLKNLVDSAKIS